MLRDARRTTVEQFDGEKQVTAIDNSAVRVGVPDDRILEKTATVVVFQRAVTHVDRFCNPYFWRKVDEASNYPVSARCAG